MKQEFENKIAREFKQEGGRKFGRPLFVCMVDEKRSEKINF